MSIESTLERIAAALEKLSMMQGAPGPVVAPTPAAEAPKPASTPAPAAPTPAPAVQQLALPFNDPATLVKYVTAAYQEMGPEKGMQIQGVLEKLGHTNVTEVPVEKYGELHQAIEALKAS